MHLHICMQVPVEAQSKILDLLKLELLAVVSPGTWSWEPNSDPSRSCKCSNHWASLQPHLIHFKLRPGQTQWNALSTVGQFLLKCLCTHGSCIWNALPPLNGKLLLTLWNLVSLSHLCSLPCPPYFLLSLTSDQTVKTIYAFHLEALLYSLWFTYF